MQTYLGGALESRSASEAHCSSRREILIRLNISSSVVDFFDEEEPKHELKCS